MSRIALGEAGINVVAGLTESATPVHGKTTVFNTAILVDRAGRIAGRHRKVHILGIASGPWEGHHCIGNSLAVGPAGVLYEAPHGPAAEDFAVVEVPL